MLQRVRFSVYICFLLLGVITAAAQESIQYGSISGRVEDASGAVIQGAKVTARNGDTNIGNAQLTDKDGRFRFPYLSVGPYEIRVQRPGFAEAVRTVLVQAGSAFELPVELGVASSESVVTVNGQADLLETARTQVAGTVSQSEVRSLPLNGRSFLDLALLIPGVSPTNTASNQLFAETSAVPGQGISIGSQRNFSNSFIVDGLSNNDDAAGLTGAFYGLDVVSELQVVTSGGQAELGRALGGYVNVVTRSGTNTLHGDLYGYFRNQRFNAANPLAQMALPLTQAQYGASLGGPIVRDRTFYFVNFEQRELNQSGLTTITPANVAAINARLTAVGYPGPQISTGIYPNPVHNTNLFAKADHQFSQKDQASIRYSLYHVTAINSRGAGGLSAPTASANLDDTDQSVAVSNIATFSTHLVNETHGQFTNSDLKAPPSDPIGPAVSISGVASFGTLSGSPTGRLNRLGEIADNLSYQAGAHAIRVGTDFLYNDDTITFPRSARGSYAFSSLANFLSGTYNASGFTQTFANSVVAQTNPNVGFYAQDEWKAAPRLTLNLGVRYDLQYLRGIATDTNNVSPRAGFAWTPFRSGKTVIRGGYGLFYDRIPLRALANALLSANNTTDPGQLSQISVSLSPAQAGAPVFPNILPSLTLPPGVLFNFSTMDPHMQNAYSDQGSFEIEQQIGARSTLSAGYQHVRGLHLIVSINQNVPTCTASGTNNGCRPNAAYGNNSQYSSLADSHYDGLHVSFVQRPAAWGNYRISYTFSKSLNNVGEFFFSTPVNQYNIWQDYGRSDDDQRHRFVLEGTVHSPSGGANRGWQRVGRGFELTAMLQYYSPLPFNITTGANTVQGTAARPTIDGVFINRNAGSGFDFLGLSARLSRSFHLSERLRMELLAEGFNLTNHLNGVTLNGVFGTGAYPTNPAPTFKQITAVNDARSLQFALRFRF
ncbi:MAG TPA: carboxypeptidase regulatory-like domain-containing protein [Candidatus Acidoferrales bacterium]|nr:carboxypeptidase regulatory-like domain-containing protein [Candidatus Acidoferrales bacterium]